MDFLKRAAEAITHSDERAAIHLKQKEEEKKKVEFLGKNDIVATQVPILPYDQARAPISAFPPTTIAPVVGAGEPEIITLRAATVDTITRAPVIDETIIQEEQEIIQPVIHREVEKTEVRHVIQPVYQDTTTATQVHERTLPAEFRAEVDESDGLLESMQQANTISQPTIVSTTASQTTTVVNEAIIHETIKPHIIEEVVPVIHRTVHEPHIIHERKDIYERIVEPPVEFVETREPIYDKTGNTTLTYEAPKAEYREAL